MTTYGGLDFWNEHVPRWPTVPLRKVASLGTGHTPSRSEPDYWVDCTIPWVTTADLTGRTDGGLRPLMETSQHISELGVANSAAVLHPTDTVMLSRTASIGHSVRIGRPMATTQAFVTWTCGPRLDPRYLLLVMNAMKPEFDRLAYGSTHMTIYFPDIEQLRVPLPPVEVQRAIADYLDTEMARIDALIAKKQRVVELLREQFESRLAAAFDVEGVPTPALSVVVRIAEGQVDPTVEPFASMMLVAPDHVESGSGRLLQAPSAAEQGAVSGKYLCEAGDVIYSKIRPALRKVCIATERCLTSADMYPMRPSPELMPPYLSYFLLSERFSSHAVLESERVAMPKINRDAFGRIRVPIPPKAEQQLVVEELDTAQSHLERVTDRVRRQIDLLRERRRALIMAAVTGELEVPGVAA